MTKQTDKREKRKTAVRFVDLIIIIFERERHVSKYTLSKAENDVLVHTQKREREGIIAYLLYEYVSVGV